jgi:SAM-dependent methyltransferase
MRTFRRETAFDAGVNLLTSFGYFEDPQDDAKVLANVAASLKPGGVFLMDIMSKEVMARIFREHDWHEEPGGTILLEERKLRDNWNWVDIRWIILHGKERHEHRFSLRLYSAADLRGLFETAGLSDVRCFGGVDGGAYDHAAERLVIVGRKPD